MKARESSVSEIVPKSECVPVNGLSTCRPARVVTRACVGLLGLAVVGASPAVAAWDWPTDSNEAAAVMSAAELDERVAMLRRLVGADPVAADIYMRQALRDSEPTLRIEALQLIGRHHLTSMLDELLAALTDRSATVRAEAVESLGLLGVHQAVDPLSRMLGDSEPDVRVAAIRALARTGSPAAASAIALSLHDRDRGIAEAAAEALGRLGSGSSVFALLEESGSPDESVAVACIEALAAIGDLRAEAALVEASRDGQRPDVAIAAIRALGALGGEQAEQAVAAQLLAPSHPDVQATALQVLSDMASEGALSSMLQLVQASKSAVIDGFDEHFIGLCGELGPSAWPQLATAWARTDGRVLSNLTLAAGWLASGDTEAVAMLDAAQRFGEIDAAFHAELLGLSTAESALCRQMRHGEGLERAMELAIRVGLDSCLSDAVQQHGPPATDTLSAIIRDGAFLHTPTNIEILATTISESRAAWDQVSLLLDELPRDHITTWHSLLSHPDTRVAREAAFVLGDAADAEWSELDVRAVLQLGQSRPWVLKAMRSIPASRRCRLVENDGLWAYADPAVGLERLELSVGCDRALTERLARASVESNDLWLQRRARSLLGGSSQSVEPGSESRIQDIGELDPDADIGPLATLADDADPLVRAAALFRLAQAESPAFTEGDLVVRLRNARTAAEHAALRLLVAAAYPEAVSLDDVDDPMVLAVLSGQQVAPQGDLVVSLSADDTGRPVVNGPLLVIYADGTISTERTDREGRWSTEQPVAFVFHRWSP